MESNREGGEVPTLYVQIPWTLHLNSSTSHITCAFVGALDGDAALAEESNVVMYEVTCGGSEESLTACGHSFSASAVSDDISCDNAYVICQGTPTMTEKH